MLLLAEALLGVVVLAEVVLGAALLVADVDCGASGVSREHPLTPLIATTTAHALKQRTTLERCTAAKPKGTKDTKTYL
ncbi:hypothetical protein CIP101434_00866 [Corynebacterium diphtheriae]|nr:hypothetical protein CIP101280_00576 [Corynebacterium diphtheriae]CAB0502184.1 hypothetical protein CIP101434_00866 [Corynebacterium diphtheriae]CAB0893569.1 hypothetical protein FRC0430_00456 [Corynebacterium diphtheriae]CAB0941939.1 hypothetical protein FRC0436_00541 [Corynebacterium diphtheriae]